MLKDKDNYAISISVYNIPVRLSIEKWKHIAEKHPELVESKNDILEAIRNPDLVQEGDFQTLMAIKRQNRLYLVVVYREISQQDGFVITAYLAERLRKRPVVWKP